MLKCIYAETFKAIFLSYLYLSCMSLLLMCFIVKCLFDLTEILRSMGRDMEGKKLS